MSGGVRLEGVVGRAVGLVHQLLKRVQRVAMDWSWALLASEGTSERAVDRKLMAWSKWSLYLMAGCLR